MKRKLMKAQKKMHKELTFSCQTNRRGERISLSPHLMIITFLMHLILQAQAVTNSAQTTLGPLVESSNGFALTQKDQDLDEEEKIPRHIVDDKHHITYTKMSNSDVLWEKAVENNWYKWVNYTAEKEKLESCIVCFESRPVLYIVPIPIHSSSCRVFHDEWFKKCPGLSNAMGLDVVRQGGKCVIERGKEINKFTNCTQKTAFCPYWCQFLQSTTKYRLATESQCIHTHTWPVVQKTTQKPQGKIQLMADQEFECYKKKGNIDVGRFEGKCSKIWKIPECKEDHSVIKEGPPPIFDDIDIALADIWWMCGPEYGLLPTLPENWSGVCNRVMLTHKMSHISLEEEATNEKKIRTKRAYEKDPAVYIDLIGQPRGIPNEFKARDEVKSGFESIFVWVAQNKNTEWINYIYYNQQRFINYTDEALSLLGEQLDATSRMTWQNRIALDYLLAEKGGVCVMFGDQCCTYIPNNTAPGGAFSKVMTKLKNLTTEVKANAGRDDQMWDWFDLKLGAWGAWLAKLGMFLGVAVLIGGLLFCCILPILRSLVVKVTAKRMEMLRGQDDDKLIFKCNQKVGLAL